MLPETKCCSRCRVDKPLLDFSKAPRGKHGRKATCKECDAAWSAARRVPRQRDEAAERERYTRARGTTKLCTKCGATKDRSEFSKSRDGKYGPVLHSACKACASTRAKQWFTDNPERTTAHKRAYTLRRYDLTPEQYEAMLTAQNGVCAICGNPETATRKGKVMQLPVDHCHTTGRVRGLLCHRCNRAIGLLRDEVGLLKTAIEYLERE